MTHLNMVRKVYRIGTLGGPPDEFACATVHFCQERGLGVDVARFMCDSLGVQCVLHRRWNNDYGTRLSDGSWTGAIGDVISGVVDTYIPVFTPSALRSTAVDFSRPFLQDGVVLMTGRPEPEPTVSNNVLRTFSPQVWTAFSLGAVALWAVRLVSDKLIGQRSPDAASRVDRLTGGQRWSIGVEWLVGLLVTTTIGGMTVRLRMDVDNRLPFVDFDSFVACLDAGRCRLASATSTVSYVRLLTDETGSFASKLSHALQKYPLIPIEVDDVVRRIFDPNNSYCLTVVTSARRAQYIQHLYRGERQFHVVVLDIPNQGAFPIQFRNNISEPLVKLATVFAEMGFGRRLYRKYGEDMSVITDVARKQLLQRPRVVKLLQMRDVFVIIVCGWSISTMVFLLELLLYRFVHHRSYCRSSQRLTTGLGRFLPCRQKV